MKKFHWRFGEKTINGVKTPVIYSKFEYNGEFTQVTENWLRLDKPYHYTRFRLRVLNLVGEGYEIVYSGKKGTKTNFEGTGNGIRVGFE